MHWFSINAESSFSKRNDIKLVRTESNGVVSGKSECRPFLVDWNRDGHDDVVVLMLIERTDYKAPPVEYAYDDSYGWELLINMGSAERKQRVEKARLAGAKSNKKSPPQDSWQSGDVEHELELKLYPTKLEPFQNIGSLAFNDFDSDGNFDMVYVETSKDESSTVFWRKNLTSQGEPEFLAAQKIYESESVIHSIAVVDFDADGVMELAVNSDGKIQLLSQIR